MMRTALRLTFGVALMVAVAEAFSTSCAFLSSPSSTRASGTSKRHARKSIMSMAVADVQDSDTFDSMIKGAKDALVIIDYSTTWCGPCKVIAPKFEEFSDKYPTAVFIKVIGDASPAASILMKREGVRSVPSFHYFKKGEKVDVVNGANAAAIEQAISKHL